MTFETLLQTVQTASIIIAMIVALGTIRARNDDKNGALIKMQSDIDYIKKTVDCIPSQSKDLAILNQNYQNMSKRLEDHLRYDHGNKEV